jgi:hypothetical protein
MTYFTLAALMLKMIFTYSKLLFLFVISYKSIVRMLIFVIDRYVWPIILYTKMGQVSSVGIATRYGLDVPGIESRWGEIFRTRADRPWGPPSVLYNGLKVSFPGKKRPGRGVDHSPQSSAEVKERVELYLFSPSGPSWSVLG